MEEECREIYENLLVFRDGIVPKREGKEHEIDTFLDENHLVEEKKLEKIKLRRGKYLRKTRREIQNLGPAKVQSHQSNVTLVCTKTISPHHLRLVFRGPQGFEKGSTLTRREEKEAQKAAKGGAKTFSAFVSREEAVCGRACLGKFVCLELERVRFNVLIPTFK